MVFAIHVLGFLCSGSGNALNYVRTFPFPVLRRICLGGNALNFVDNLSFRTFPFNLLYFLTLSDVLFIVFFPVTASEVFFSSIFIIGFLLRFVSGILSAVF